jgi:hypothetical protein
VTHAAPERDERTTFVENEGYRRSYFFVTFGLLAVVIYRSFRLDDTSWDLLALVILGGAVNVGWQAFHRVLYKRRALQAMLTVLAAGLVAAAIVFSNR